MKSTAPARAPSRRSSWPPSLLAAPDRRAGQEGREELQARAGVREGAAVGEGRAGVRARRRRRALRHRVPAPLPPRRLQRLAGLHAKGRALADQGDYIGAYNAFRQAYGYDPVNDLAAQEMERVLRLQREKEGADDPRTAQTRRRVLSRTVVPPRAERRRARPTARRGRPRAPSSSRTSSTAATSKASSASWPTS